MTSVNVSQTLTYQRGQDVQQASRAWEKQAQALVLMHVQDLLRIEEYFNLECGSEGVEHIRLHWAHAGRFGLGGSIAGTGAGGGRLFGAAFSRLVGLWTTRHAGRAGPVGPSSGGGELAGGGGGGGCS
jgi:hypothetical protein